MSRRTSRRRQQSMNERRRTGRMYWCLDHGIPFEMAPGAWFIPADPVKERQDFVRQLMARVALEPGVAVFPAEVGIVEGMRIVMDAPPEQVAMVERAFRDAIVTGTGIHTGLAPR